MNSMESILLSYQYHSSILFSWHNHQFSRDKISSVESICVVILLSKPVNKIHNKQMSTYFIVKRLCCANTFLQCSNKLNTYNLKQQFWKWDLGRKQFGRSLGKYCFVNPHLWMLPSDSPKDWPCLAWGSHRDHIWRHGPKYDLNAEQQAELNLSKTPRPCWKSVLLSSCPTPINHKSQLGPLL